MIYQVFDFNGQNKFGGKPREFRSYIRARAAMLFRPCAEMQVRKDDGTPVYYLNAFGARVQSERKKGAAK